LGPDQRATQAIEEEMFCPLDDVVRNSVQRDVGHPGGESSGRPRWIGGGLLLHGGHRIPIAFA
jgi:hypothetical protein